MLFPDSHGHRAFLPHGIFSLTGSFQFVRQPGFYFRFHLRRQLGLVGGDIVNLQRVRLQVVELPVRIAQQVRLPRQNELIAVVA